MRVAFRVDVSREIGLGHFMRCLTLATALKKRGAQTRFVCRHLPANLRQWLEAQGHPSNLLDGDAEKEHTDDLAHSRFLGTSQRQDAYETHAALSSVGCDLMVVDHYAIDARWESAVRSVARRILVIDDIADRVHDCDILVDQNLFADMDRRYTGKVPTSCRLLLGPRYALLREEFQTLREHVKPRAGPVRRVLVFMGGMDPKNLTGRVIRVLQEVAEHKLHVDVVIGEQQSRKAEVEAHCKVLGFVCHIQTARMAELMKAADLAIGAGGSASWERCCMGLGSLLVAFADNQSAIAVALQEAGASQYLGDEQSATEGRIKEELLALLTDSDRLAAMSRNAWFLVDGRGMERVGKEIGWE